MKDLYLLLLTLLTLNCNGPDTAIGGTDTELTGKPIAVGSVYALNGDPATGVTVKLIPSDFRPGIDDDSLIRSGLTGNSGEYEIAIQQNIPYNLLARDMINNTTLFETKVILPQNDTGTISVGSDTLRESGNITLTLSDSVVASGTVISITGTDISTTGTEKAATISNIPTGDFAEVVVYDSTSEEVTTTIEEIIVKANDTTELPYNVSVLVLYESDDDSSHLFLVEELKTVFNSVVTMKREEMNSMIVSSYNTVFISASVDSLVDSTGFDHSGTFSTTTVPVICGSVEVADELNFTTQSPLKFTEDIMSHGTITSITPPDYSNSLQVYIFNDGSNREISALIPAGSGKSVLYSENSSYTSTLVTYEIASAMGNGKVATGRRAAIFETDDYRTLSEVSLSYIKRTILWSVKKL